MSSGGRALLLLNRAAGQGRAGQRYERVRESLAVRFALEETEMDSGRAWEGRLAGALRSGVRIFLAAGGDGTVNTLANALFARRAEASLAEITLGAVALGSSNDFHKPFGAFLRGVPVRIDALAAAPRDLARATWEDGRGVVNERLFLVSASLGVTALANALFDRQTLPGRLLKRRWAGMAIFCAAALAILRHRGQRATLRLPDATQVVDISNLSVMKTPHLSGSLRYDTPVLPASGLFAVNLCLGMSRLRLAATLARLAAGRFLGHRGTRHWTTSRIGVELESPGRLELDGEVCLARKVVFDLLPERLSVCA